jgi:sugar lactone lactonase YvrE
MSPNQFKLALVGLALGGAALGGGVAYLLVHSSAKAPEPAQQQAAAAAKPVATAPGWTGRLETVAGDGLPGSSNGAGRTARFGDPYGVVIDSAGTLYVADGGDNNTIRKIDTQGKVSVLAGDVEGYAEGAGKLAAFNTPSGLALDSKGNLLVADTGNNAIRKVAPDGTVSTVAGNSLAGNQDGRAPQAQFNGPLGVAVDAENNVYVADSYNDRIRKISWDGVVTTLAGSTAGNVDGAGAQARFDTPSALVLAPNGDLYVADTGNNAVRKIAKDGTVSTVAAVTDDKERDALLRRPVALALSHDGYLYVASGSHGRIAQISPKGEVLALADVDHPPAPGNGDGKLRLYAPRGLALARDGSLYLSDAATFRVQHFAPPVAGAAAPPDVTPPVPSHGATMLWPVKPQDKAHEVVGLLGEVRGNYDHESRDHFHAGLDVQANPGTPVLAMLPAKVRDPLATWGFNDLGEGMSLDGFNYIHMKVGRAPNDKALDPRFLLSADDKGKPFRVRVKRGTRFLVGETLGTINGMAHVHLDYKPNGDALNPLALPFVELEDTVAPTIAGIQIIGQDGKPLKDKRDGRVLVPRTTGNAQIVVDAYDQMEGNKDKRRLGLYKLGYQLLRVDGSVLPDMAQPVITQLYDRLPRDREAVKLAYADASGITVYGNKTTRFVYDLNTTVMHGKVAPGAWKVDGIEPGNYILRITAEDFAGNAANRDRDLLITVE